MTDKVICPYCPNTIDPNDSTCTGCGGEIKGYEIVAMSCDTCNEEYNLPEDTENCPFCGEDIYYEQSN